MKLEDIVKGLQAHNAWRRGVAPYAAGEYECPHPPPHSSKQLGELLDAAIRELEEKAPFLLVVSGELHVRFVTKTGFVEFPVNDPMLRHQYRCWLEGK